MSRLADAFLWLGVASAIVSVGLFGLLLGAWVIDRVRNRLDDRDRRRHIAHCERTATVRYREQARVYGEFANQLQEIRSLPAVEPRRRIA